MQQLYGPEHIVHGAKGGKDLVVVVEVALDKLAEVVEVNRRALVVS